MISTNSSLRVVEQLQLKWNDVKIEKLKNSDGEEVKLACIKVRAENCYVGKDITLKDILGERKKMTIFLALMV